MRWSSGMPAWLMVAYMRLARLLVVTSSRGSASFCGASVTTSTGTDSATSDARRSLLHDLHGRAWRESA